jgi:hypothetical protein
MHHGSGPTSNDASLANWPSWPTAGDASIVHEPLHVLDNALLALLPDSVMHHSMLTEPALVGDA